MGKRLGSNRRTINERGTVPRTFLWFGWTVPSSDGTIVKQQESNGKAIENRVKGEGSRVWGPGCRKSSVL